ncbi:MAG TPA: hypothetical protein VMM35_01780, partial [Longimicrobiales bacterium]|nr:hypothetical protein [Longimicrobiales bacterium]
ERLGGMVRVWAEARAFARQRDDSFHPICMGVDEGATLYPFMPWSGSVARLMEPGGERGANGR